MNSGDLDRRIVIENYTTTRDSYGEPIKTWATFATRWAMKRDDLETERTELDQLVAVNRTVWKIRHTDNLTTAMRIVYDSKHYYITGIKELGRREGMQITTELRE